MQNLQLHTDQHNACKRFSEDADDNAHDDADDDADDDEDDGDDDDDDDDGRARSKTTVDRQYEKLLHSTEYCAEYCRPSSGTKATSKQRIVGRLSRGTRFLPASLSKMHSLESQFAPCDAPARAARATHAA